MAGHVPKRVLKQPEVDKMLLGGTPLYRWEEGDPNLRKLDFFADKEAFFLYARADDKTKVYDNYIWDIFLISDIRPAKCPKDPKLLETLTQLTASEKLEDHLLTLVYRRDGIVNLDYINLACEWAETADKFKRAVNALTFNMLHAHAAPSVIMHKNYVKILLHSNGYGQISLKHINRLMMLRHNPDNYINLWLKGFNIVKTSKDDGSDYIKEEDFTEDIFMRMVDQILNNRVGDIDVVFSSVIKKATKAKVHLNLEDFHKFLNDEQRDPRLNEILHPVVSRSQAKAFIGHHEKGKYSDRLTSKGLMEYLMSEENNILDMVHLDQDNDMNQPLNHYFINSSHNTYLTGHQLKSASTVEMYIQALLLGCRCVELDCWPSSDNEDIVITHGGTLCGKVSFKDVVEGINEFAFVTSEYPVILSIENHCKSRPNLIQRMSNIFVTTFGDKLMKAPIEGYPLEPGVPLPSPERLKGKILLKDKVKRQKGAQYDTLTRGAHMPPLDEIPEALGVGKTNGEQNNNGNSSSLEDTGSEQKGEEEGKEGETAAEQPKQKEEEANDEPDGTVEEQKPSIDSEGEGKTAEGEGKTAEGEGPTSHESTATASGMEESCEENNIKKKLKAMSSFDSGDSMSGTPIHKKSNSTDMDDIELIVPRHVDTEAFVSGPLVDLLNYCTGMSFEGFATAEKLNCSYYMSSFVEEKGLNFIKTQARDFVKYNMRQHSRVYPQGSRFNSSNYMPQIFWNVGCQLVALNYQTPDLPLQLNHAKFEFNGATGYMLKPWVLLTERKKGGGAFNPFVQSKLEDIVPAKLSIKIISGFFLTKKNTNCYVEAELYGLPADTVRHKYYTRKKEAPHPFWNDEIFTFKRILLPELALLRVAVFDDDREMIGQRFLPVNAIRPGFRHIPLRDKHNQPLPLAMLFVSIKVEDWVPNEMEEVVAMLMDPMSFASKALADLAMGEFDEETDANGDPTSRPPGPPAPISEGGSVQMTPKHVTISDGPGVGGMKRKASNDAGVPLPPQLPASGSAHNTPRKSTTLPAGSSFAFDETLPRVEKAKQRSLPIAVTHDSKVITDHPEYKKLSQKLAKQKAVIVKKQEKLMKSTRDKQAKSKSPDETVVKQLEDQQGAELLAFERKAITERHEKQKMLIGFVHSVQLKDIEKVQKEDLRVMNQELGQRMKQFRKGSDATDRQAALREIEEQTISLGKKSRNDLSRIHQQEFTKLQDGQKEAIQKLTKVQEKELAELGKASEGAGASAEDTIF